MNRLKLNTHTLFLGVGIITVAFLQASDSKELLQQLLLQRPELAQQFANKIETQETTTEDARKQVASPPAAKKTGLTEQEKLAIQGMFTILETYTTGVYNCLESFFNKQNCLPYRLHIAGFKNQLDYLRQNLIQKFPQAYISEQQPLFTSLHTLLKALERSQELLVGALDQCYAQSIFGAKALSDQFDKIEAPINAQRSIIGKSIQVLNREFKTVSASDILARLLKITKQINKIFDYGKDKNFLELGALLIHRLQR